MIWNRIVKWKAARFKGAGKQWRYAQSRYKLRLGFRRLQHFNDSRQNTLPFKLSPMIGCSTSGAWQCGGHEFTVVQPLSVQYEDLLEIPFIAIVVVQQQ